MRLGRAWARYAAGPPELAGAFVEGCLVGVVGYQRHGAAADGVGSVELLHLATAAHWQGRGVAAAMIGWVRGRYPGDRVEAQTDGDAVGFYRAVGFSIASLGELYPGVERFQVVRVS